MKRAEARVERIPSGHPNRIVMTIITVRRRARPKKVSACFRISIGTFSKKTISVVIKKTITTSIGPLNLSNISDTCAWKPPDIKTGSCEAILFLIETPQNILPGTAESSLHRLWNIVHYQMLFQN